MRVFVLGGAGRHGRRAVFLLSSSPEVSEVVIAARDRAAAESIAGQVGPKASVCQVDALDEQGVAQAARGSSVLINASGPYFETLLPALRAAIRAGIHYCDFSEDGRTVEQAFALDSAAKSAGISAILGIGDAPGVTNLMALHASRQLDRTEDIVVGWTDDFEVVYRSVQENLRTLRMNGHVDASLQATLNASTGQIRTFVAGRWMEEEALGRAVSVMLPTGQGFTAFPLGWAEPVTLPRSIPGLRSVVSLVNLLPHQMNDLMRAEASVIARGALRPREATIDMLQVLNVDPARWLSRPKDMMVGALFAMARGIKDGHPAICSTVPNWAYLQPPSWLDGLGTGAPCALAALRILRGEVERPGVIGPEACFEPIPFFAELVQRWGSCIGPDLVRQEISDPTRAIEETLIPAELTDGTNLAPAGVPACRVDPILESAGYLQAGADWACVPWGVVGLRSAPGSHMDRSPAAKVIISRCLLYLDHLAAAPLICRAGSMRPAGPCITLELFQQRGRHLMPPSR